MSPNGKRPAESPDSPPAKRSKLSDTAKAQKEAEKEERRKKLEAKRIFAEEKRKAKEEERKARDEEKKIRDQQRRTKDEEKRAKKDAEEVLRRAAAEALMKKEKSQLRMVNFFKKVEGKARSEPDDSQQTIFKPFHVKEHTRLGETCKAPVEAIESFGRSLSYYSAHKDIQTLDQGQLFGGRKRRKCSVRSLPLRERLQVMSNQPLDDQLCDLKYKLLQFHTDVRPAYFGTMSSNPQNRRLGSGRNPLSKSSLLNYDYDSEADWVQGDDDDEDIGDEDDDSVASKDTYGDDDDDFLDDTAEYTHETRQKGQLIPSILGIFTGEDGSESFLEGTKFCKLISAKGPIDPFKDYWDSTPKKSETTEVALTVCASGNESVNAAKLIKKSCSKGSIVSAFPASLLSDFKKAIQGSTLRKAMLVEKLRSDFQDQKVTKKVIEAMIGEVAQRRGKGQHDVWVLL